MSTGNVEAVSIRGLRSQHNFSHMVQSTVLFLRVKEKKMRPWLENFQSHMVGWLVANLTRIQASYRSGEVLLPKGLKLPASP